MKLTGSKETIFNAFKTAAKALTQSAGKSVPQEIKVECLSDGTVRLFATDLERSLKVSVNSSGIKVSEPGEAAIHGLKTVAILSSIGEEKIGMETSPEGNFLLISCQGGQFKVNMSPIDEFPPFPEPAWEDPIKLKGNAWRAMIESTSFATAQEKVHFSLHGIFMRVEKNSMRMVGTDGRRLSIVNGRIARKSQENIEIIVPNKGIKLFEETAGEEEEVEISFERNQLFMRAGGIEAGTLLIDGKYPDYQKAIPKDNDLTLDVDTEEFFSAIRKASVFAEAETKGVWLKLNPQGVVMTSNSAGSGEAEIAIPASFSGDTLEIQFNPEFIKGARKLITGDRMKIQLKDPKTAAILHASDEFTYVVMPIVKK